MKIKEIKELLPKLQLTQEYIMKSKEFFIFLEEILQREDISYCDKCYLIKNLYNDFKKEAIKL